MSVETCQTPAETSKTSLFDPCTPSMRHETVRRHDPHPVSAARRTPAQSPAAARRDSSLPRAFKSLSWLLVGRGLDCAKINTGSDSHRRSGRADSDSAASRSLGPAGGRPGSEPRRPSEPEWPPARHPGRRTLNLSLTRPVLSSPADGPRRPAGRRLTVQVPTQPVIGVTSRLGLGRPPGPGDSESVPSSPVLS